VVYASPADDDARANLAEICVTRLSIKLPALVDRVDDAADNAYSGWPDRLFLVGRDRRIVYRSNPGPFGFTPADLESALRAQLNKP
jgi:type I thyroxine 5'-deiodinase